MFESRKRLQDEIERLLDVLRALGAGRYACCGNYAVTR